MCLFFDWPLDSPSFLLSFCPFLNIGRNSKIKYRQFHSSDGPVHSGRQWQSSFGAPPVGDEVSSLLFPPDPFQSTLSLLVESQTFLVSLVPKIGAT